MEILRLIGSRHSAYCHRVIWALKIKGVEYNYSEENLEKKSDDIVRYNPILQRIPILVHYGMPVIESIYILEYIEETWPHNPLVPNDPYEKALARFWAKFLEDKSPTFYAYFRAEGEEQEKLANEAKEFLSTLEEKGLGEKKFFGGDEIGYTDLCLGWISCYLELMQQAAGIKILETEHLPKLHAWCMRFKEVPVIKDNIPDDTEMLAYFRGLRAKFTASATS